MLNNKKIGFIGFGLIAGSIARALRRDYKDVTMIALNNRYPDIKPGLKLAIEEGTLNDLRPAIDEDFADCDIVFLAAPVKINVSYLPKLKEIMKGDYILTDVGSVKGDIHKAVAEAGLEEHFIGGHPMAGTEKTGYENSFVEMLENAYYILTPTDKVSEDKIEIMKAITRATRSKCVTLNPDEHDTAAAAISHVPHILSYTLVNTVREQDTKEQYMKQLAAGGFRDMTRIASSSPDMWQSIVLSNKEAVQSFLKEYLNTLQRFSDMLEVEDKDGIYDFFKESKEYRDTFTFFKK